MIESGYTIFMRLGLPTLFSLLLVVLNLYIYRYTTNKISLYKHTPPFPSLDYTGSGDSIYYLTDGNHTTYWRKGLDGKEWDFEIELRFTHKYYNGMYEPVLYKELSIVPCEGYSPPDLFLEIFKREGINVDIELRMPKDVVIQTVVLESIKKPHLQDISKLFNNSQTYMSYDGMKMSILGVRGRIKSSNSPPCLAEISLVQ